MKVVETRDDKVKGKPVDKDDGVVQLALERLEGTSITAGRWQSRRAFNTSTVTPRDTPGRDPNIPGRSRMPNAGPNEPCALMALPTELKVNILRQLFYFNADLHVGLDPEDAKSPPFKNNFVVGKPLIPKFPLNVRNRWILEILCPKKDFFALSQANKELHALGLEIFYKESKFVFDRFHLIQGVADVKAHHFERWERAIGAQAREFLQGNCVFDGVRRVDDGF